MAKVADCIMEILFFFFLKYSMFVFHKPLSFLTWIKYFSHVGIDTFISNSLHRSNYSNLGSQETELIACWKKSGQFESILRTSEIGVIFSRKLELKNHIRYNVQCCPKWGQIFLVAKKTYFSKIPEKSFPSKYYCRWLSKHFKKTTICKNILLKFRPKSTYRFFPHLMIRFHTLY